MSTKRRTLGVHSQPRPLGPNGEKLCFNCLGPLPKGRPYNCSPKCSEEWQCKTSTSYLRAFLKQRDRGVCALCGLDTIALREEYDSLGGAQWRNQNWGLPDSVHELRRQFRQQHGIPSGRSFTDFWDADHILPVIEGGGECGPDGYRTLCIPCHKKETAALAKRRAEARKNSNLLPLLEAVK